MGQVYTGVGPCIRSKMGFPLKQGKFILGIETGTKQAYIWVLSQVCTGIGTKLALSCIKAGLVGSLIPVVKASACLYKDQHWCMLVFCLWILTSGLGGDYVDQLATRNTGASATIQLFNWLLHTIVYNCYICTTLVISVPQYALNVNEYLKLEVCWPHD